MKPKELLELYHSGVAFSYASEFGIDGIDNADAYPQGVSAFRIYNDATWPSSYGNVITMKMAGARFSQIYVEKSNTAVYYRGLDGNGPALLPWRLVYDTGGWISLSLQNSWINYGSVFSPAAYRRDNDNIVRLRGLVRNGTGSPSRISTIPYAPTKDYIFMAVSDNSSVQVAVASDGDITVAAPFGTWVSLEGITFPTV